MKDREYIDLSIVCECGNHLNMAHGMEGIEWPLIFVCKECRTNYVISRNKPE